MKLDPRLPATLLLAGLLCLGGCAAFRHQFAEPTPAWQSRVGQLQYRGEKVSLIGEVLVRYSQRGDFELTFTKGPGVPLITVKQDPQFVRVSGPLARGSWSGPPNETPKRLRGWASLRSLLLGEPKKQSLHANFGRESFSFAF